jgi:solute carrier family 24 (sodium/potassium/calcium exchanger), member 2
MKMIDKSAKLQTSVIKYK